jgi:hypothetical protein
LEDGGRDPACENGAVSPARTATTRAAAPRGFAARRASRITPAEFARPLSAAASQDRALRQARRASPGAAYWASSQVASARCVQPTGWAMETYLRTELLLRALDIALGQLRPDGVTHNSDQPEAASTFRLLSANVAAGRRAATNGFGRRLLPQRQMRELLRYARMRVARPAKLHNPSRGPHGGL